MAEPGFEALSDDDLVAAANRGRAGALEAIYHRYRDWAASLAFRFLGDRDAAQDVVQEAFAYLFGKFPGFRLRGGARLTTALYPAVRHTALAMRRKKRPEAMGDRLEVFAGPATPVPQAAIGGTPDMASLAAAVGRLGDGHREVLLMRVVDEMSVAEIALALGIPEGTVKSRLHHALAALRADPGAGRYFEG